MSDKTFIVEGRYRLAAEQGKPEAQFNYGRMCEQGNGAPQSFQEAAQWYRKAAEQGHINAQLALGYLYEPLSRGISMRNWPSAISTNRETGSYRATAKRSSGIGKPRNRGMPTPSTTWV